MKHKWFQSHKWQAIAAESGTNRFECAITVVLYACSCGEHKTETFNGPWTLEQLTTVPSADHKDISELRKMAGLK